MALTPLDRLKATLQQSPFAEGSPHHSLALRTTQCNSLDLGMSFVRALHNGLGRRHGLFGAAFARQLAWGTIRYALPEQEDKAFSDGTISFYARPGTRERTE